MSGISAFIHYHILRKMCDQENEKEKEKNIGIVTLTDIIDYHNNKPDIEMGYKIQPKQLPRPSTQPIKRNINVLV